MQNKPVSECFVQIFQLVSFDSSFQMSLNMKDSKMNNENNLFVVIVFDSGRVWKIASGPMLENKTSDEF